MPTLSKNTYVTLGSVIAFCILAIPLIVKSTAWVTRVTEAQETTNKTLSRIESLITKLDERHKTDIDLLREGKLDKGIQDWTRSQASDYSKALEKALGVDLPSVWSPDFHNRQK